MNAKSPTVQTWLFAGALTLVTFALFAPALNNGFVAYDDPKYIYENPHVQEGLTGPNIAWAFTTGYFSNWHPLTWLSYMADTNLFGTAPWGYHLTNVALHAVNAGLLVLVLTALTGNPVLSLIAAALFAVHPLRVESVVWISERKDVLSAFFGLLAIQAYVAYVRTKAPWRYALVALWLALGLMAKPMLVTWPFVLLLLDFWPLRRFEQGPAVIRRAVVEKLPLLALAAASSVITYIVQSRGAVTSLDQMPFGLRLENVLTAYIRYLANVIWPGTHLTFHYALRDPAWTAVAASALTLVVVTASVLLFLRRAPYLAVGWFWFLGTLIPVIGLIQVGGTALADRYTYLSTIGIIVAFLWLTAGVVARYPKIRWFALGAVVAYTAVLGALPVRQTAVWHDSERLFRHGLTVEPDNAFVHFLLGNHLAGNDRVDEGRAHLEEAVLRSPDMYRALNDLGAIYKRMGRQPEAEQLLRRCVEVAPNFPNGQMNLGDLLAHTGRVEEGLEHLRIAYQYFEPGDPNHAAVAAYIPQLEAYLQRQGTPQP